MNLQLWRHGAPFHVTADSHDRTSCLRAIVHVHNAGIALGELRDRGEGQGRRAQTEINVFDTDMNCRSSLPATAAWNDGHSTKRTMVPAFEERSEL